MGNFIHCSEEIKNSNYNCFLPELVFDYPTEFIIYNIFLQFLNFISKILSCLSSILVTLFSLTKLTFILADQLIIYIWGSDHIKNKNNHIEKINNEMLFFINIKYLLILCIVNFFIIYIIIPLLQNKLINIIKKQHFIYWKLNFQYINTNLLKNYSNNEIGNLFYRAVKYQTEVKMYQFEHLFYFFSQILVNTLFFFYLNYVFNLFFTLDINSQIILENKKYNINLDILYIFVIQIIIQCILIIISLNMSLNISLINNINKYIVNIFILSIFYGIIFNKVFTEYMKLFLLNKDLIEKGMKESIEKIQTIVNLHFEDNNKDPIIRISAFSIMDSKIKGNVNLIKLFVLYTIYKIKYNDQLKDISNIQDILNYYKYDTEYNPLIHIFFIFFPLSDKNKVINYVYYMIFFFPIILLMYNILDLFNGNNTSIPLLSLEYNIFNKICKKRKKWYKLKSELIQINKKIYTEDLNLISDKIIGLNFNLKKSFYYENLVINDKFEIYKEYNYILYPMKYYFNNNICFLGDSGSGKTTLMNILNGNIDSDNQKIIHYKLFGKNYTKDISNTNNNLFSFIPQVFNFYRHSKVKDILLLFNDMKNKDYYDVLKYKLKLNIINNYEDTIFSELSGGQQYRTLLLGKFLQISNLQGFLFIDELIKLDPLLKKEIYNMLKNFNYYQKLSFNPSTILEQDFYRLWPNCNQFFITHVFDEVKNNINQILYIREGKTYISNLA